MGKSTISMAISSSYVSLPEGITFRICDMFSIRPQSYGRPAFSFFGFDRPHGEHFASWNGTREGSVLSGGGQPILTGLPLI